MHALIDESRCIGCTKCISACDHNAIVGARKMVHTVLENACTTCGDCLPVCPVDCITWSEESVARGGGQPNEVRPTRSVTGIAPLDAERVILAKAGIHGSKPSRSDSLSSPLPPNLLAQITAARNAANTKFTTKKGPLNTPKALRRKQAK